MALNIAPRILLHSGIRYAENELLHLLSERFDAHWYYPSSLVNAQLTLACNLRCQQCSAWKVRRRPELSTAQWKAIIADVRAYLGPFYLRFYGGEPLLRRDLTELMQFAVERDICPLLTTNGTLLDRSLADELVRLKLGLVNISLDGARPATHDALRGRDGTFERAMGAIELLRGRLPLQVNTTVMEPNLDELLELARLADRLGVQIYFQGLLNFEGRESGDEFRFQHAHHPLFPRDPRRVDAVLDELERFGRRSRCIVNSAEQLQRMRRYYSHSPQLSDEPCGAVRYNHLVIKARGELQICSFFGTLGNLTERSLGEIWRCPRTAATVRAMRRCPERACTVVRGYHRESYREVARKVLRSAFNRL